MKTIEAYRTADGKIYESEKAAIAHDEDLLGEALDGLFTLFELDVSRSQQHKALLCVMKKRDALTSSVNEILHVLNHAESDD